jgi:hypothetical protein
MVVEIIPVINDSIIRESHLEQDPAIQKLVNIQQKLQLENERIEAAMKKRDELRSRLVADRWKTKVFSGELSRSGGGGTMDKLELAKYTTEVSRSVAVLDQILLELDSVDTHGDEHLRAARKHVLGEIQALIEVAETNLTRAKKLMQVQKYFDSISSPKLQPHHGVVVPVQVSDKSSNEPMEILPKPVEERLVDDAMMMEESKPTNITNSTSSKSDDKGNNSSIPTSPLLSSSPRKRFESMDDREGELSSSTSTRSIGSGSSNNSSSGGGNGNGHLKNKSNKKVSTQQRPSIQTNYDDDEEMEDAISSPTQQQQHYQQQHYRSASSRNNNHNNQSHHHHHDQPKRPNIELRETQTSAVLIVKEPNARDTKVVLDRDGDLEIHVPGKVVMSYDINPYEYVASRATKQVLRDGSVAIVIPRRPSMPRVVRWPFL